MVLVKYMPKLINQKQINEIIKLKDEEKLSFKDIAAKIGISSESARKKYKQELQKNSQEPEASATQSFGKENKNLNDTMIKIGYSLIKTLDSLSIQASFHYSESGYEDFPDNEWSSLQRDYQDIEIELIRLVCPLCQNDKMKNEIKEIAKRGAKSFFLFEPENELEDNQKRKWVKLLSEISPEKLQDLILS